MALGALCVTDPVRKAYAVQSLWAQLEARDPGLRIDTAQLIAAPEGLPGRPPLPRLVPAVEVPPRSPFTPEGRAALLHAIAHIEFNAIKLALHVGVVTRRSFLYHKSAGKANNLSFRGSLSSN